MDSFFKVKNIDDILNLIEKFKPLNGEKVYFYKSLNRVLAEDIYSKINIPNFNRSTMDGYAINAYSSFGCSELNPGFLKVIGEVEMGELSEINVLKGEAVKIPTGGNMPIGSDSVIMVEYTSSVGNDFIEIYKSITPGENVIHSSEDVEKGSLVLKKGIVIRPQEIGLLASLGESKLKVFKKPEIAIISTGNELVSSKKKISGGRIRDVNSYTLYNQILESGGLPKSYGIVPDDFNLLKNLLIEAIYSSDIVIISGGSSLGQKDLTLKVIQSIENTQLLFHGLSISPGKPTILAQIGNKQIWGLPGHIVSAMIVFKVVVSKFLDRISGKKIEERIIPTISAVLTRNIASTQGRVDYVRVKIKKIEEDIFAEPIIGKSGLISNIVKADGLIEVGINVEGVYEGSLVSVIPL